MTYARYFRIDENRVCFIKTNMDLNEYILRRKFIGIHKGKEITKEFEEWICIYEDYSSYSSEEVYYTPEGDIYEYYNGCDIDLSELNFCVYKMNFCDLNPFIQQEIYNNEQFRALLNLKHEDVDWEGYDDE